LRIAHFEKQSELVRPTLLEALFPKVRAEVLCLLFTNAGQELYVRQLAQRVPKREIGVSQQILTDCNCAHLWIYDLRINKHFTLKENPLKRR